MSPRSPTMARNLSRSFASMVTEKNSTHLAERESTFRRGRNRKRGTPSSMDDELCERINVSLEKDQDPDQASQGNTMPENVAQNATFVSIPFRGGAGDDDTLRIDHLAHDATTTVCGGHKHR